MRFGKANWKIIAVASLLPLASSCNLLVPLAFFGEHKKSVSAEFDKLAGSRVAVLVWTNAATLFDYPYARFELASYTGDKLEAEMAQRRNDVDMVDPRDVEDYLQRNLDAQVDPAMLGKYFKTDYIIYVEVYEFQIRDPQNPQFLRGKISASTTVHDVRANPVDLPVYELTPVECVYPEGPPILMTGNNTPFVREATYQLFAETVARKFYEHTIAL